MTPERVYALLVEANPVPEPDAYLEAMIADQGSLRLVDSRRENMKTQEPIRELTPESPAKRPWMAAAAAAIVIVLAIGVVAWLAGSGDEAPVVDEVPPTTAVIETASAAEALAATEAFFAALSAGDIDAVARITNPGGNASEADRRMWGFNAALFAAGYEWGVGACTATTNPAGSRVAVECPYSVGFPPFIALGITDLVSPFDYLTDSGELRWSEFEGADFSSGNAATADYLRTFHLADYDAFCAPTAYETGGVVQDRGLSLTPECAAVIIPLMDDLVAWIESGQPDPEEAALSATDAFFTALLAGDIDGVEQAVIPGGELADSERRMWQFNMASFAAGYQGDVGECTATHDTAANRVAVACQWTVGDPVFLAMGITELEWPFDYFVDDGRLAWRPFQGADVSPVNQATAAFLDAFHADEYAAACDPAAYNFQGIVFDRGLALTPECAELLVPLLGDVAAWVEAGQPTTG